MIWDLQITERDGVRVHRARLEPGEASPWHVDSFHRVTVVLQGEQLRIEYQEGGEPELVPVVAGQVDWDEPSAPRVHRAVNSGQLPYEEVVVALIGRA
jgi:quercetin dioxygenase-like cupin family protein